MGSRAACASIASRLAGEIYGLDVLAEDVEDETHNTTRFVVLARDAKWAAQGSGPLVTTFVFRVRNLPAALYKAMGGFATNGVNMTKLESYMINGEFADDLARSLRGAIREGIAGWRDDDLAFTAEWGFGLDALSGRAAIWQGDQDNMVPFAHGQWLAANIPGARAHLLPGEGHLTMTVSALGRVLDDLLDLAGPS